MTNRLNCVLGHIFISTCAVSVALFVNNNDKMSVECYSLLSICVLRWRCTRARSAFANWNTETKDCSKKPMICDFIEFPLLAPLLFQLSRLIRNLKLHSFVSTSGKYVCLKFGLPLNWKGMEKSLSIDHSQIKASEFPSYFLIFSCVTYFQFIKTNFGFCQQ